MKKIKVKMNKPVYLGLSILKISKTLIYEFWYHYIKTKYQNNANLCYMDTDNFIIHIKTEYVYEDVAHEKTFDTSNYEVSRPLPAGKNKKLIGLMKEKLGRKIIIEFATLTPKTYSHLGDDDIVHKRAKGTKNCVIK